MEQYLSNIALMCGVIFFIAGFIMYKWPPKSINHLYGYRTNLSMKSQRHWDFSQRYSAIQMIKMAGIMIVVGILLNVFHINEIARLAIGLIILFTMVIWMFLSTERAIRNKFKN